MRSLTELLQAVPDIPELSLASADLPISAITADSRQVVPGSLFVALKGEKNDGTRFIAQARQAGAVAVLCEADAAIDEQDMVVIRAPNARQAQALMAAAFYGEQPEHIVAITGTDGKTSTADFFRQCWHLMGQSSASMGTLGVIDGSGTNLYPGTLTTPATIELQRILAELASKQVAYVAMEASSHGLHQHRLDGVRLQAAAFTNIARDHLDYHGTPDAYFAAKARLFDTLLPTGGVAVLNQDDSHFPMLKYICKARGIRIIGFGREGDAMRIVSLDPLPHGQRVQLDLFGQDYTLDVPLVGAFQVMNILAAMGLVIATGGDLDAAVGVVPKLQGVPGRLEQVAHLKNGATVFIDYAHTPMALANILNTLRPHTQKQLHVVFGCGGDRDTGKRPEMGAIAVELADNVIVTDDNPRSEDPASIRRAVLEAAPHAREVADRAEAIRLAMSGLGAGDILVIAGKGHEKTQIVGNVSHPFDDAEVARKAAKELKLV